MKVAVFPLSRLFCKDELFNLDSVYNRDSSDRYPFWFLKRELAGDGIIMHTFDTGSIRKYDKLLMFNYDRQAAQLAAPFICRKDRVLFIIEPPAVEPGMWTHEAFDHYRRFFDKTYVYADDVIDNVNIFKYHIPPNHPVNMSSGPVPPDGPRRHLLAFIQSNRTSCVPGELYTFRRQLAEFLDRRLSDFSVYGCSWILKSAKGTCKNKLNVLSQHTFSLVVENQCLAGWISERIFECFIAGCIPVYYGAPNVQDYIPENTFIDYRKFASTDLLAYHLENMGRDRINFYRQNIRSFLESQAFSRFSVENFAGTVRQSLCL